MRYHIKNIKLAREGRLRIEWAEKEMPVLRLIRQRFKKEKPLRGIRISCCLHVTSETANLLNAMKTGGANAVLCASNPLSTQDQVAASLVKDFGIPVFAICGEDKKTYYQHIRAALNHKPHLTMDDGADLVSTLHSKAERGGALIKNVIGGSEETTTGVTRLRSMESSGVLRYPIIAVNDAQTKHFFDNRYGTGQSTIDGILRATNVLLAGKNFVVCGYGWCGRGVATRARGMGSNVVVTEVDPLKAMEAVMDGFRVVPVLEAARIGDIFVTLTGDINVIGPKHFRRMKDGAIICNSGHFNVEVNIEGLKRISRKRRRIRQFVEEYTLPNGRRINLLAEGRLVNLAAAEGHPASVMDMSFANQALCAEYLTRQGKNLARKVYPVPKSIDRKVACLKLKTMGVKIDGLTGEQKKYLSSWETGT
jgi:adenosylhomocysteinase